MSSPKRAKTAEGASAKEEVATASVEAAAPGLVLAYWAIRGLAQPIRLLLEHVGAKYEDKRFVQGGPPAFDKSCWYDVKETLLGDHPWPNLPYLIDAGTCITQSNAILRHIGRKHNLLGQTPAEQARVDMVLEEAMELRNRTVGYAYSGAEKWSSATEANYTKRLHEDLALWSKALGKSAFFAGEQVTVGDFVLYEQFDQNNLMIKGSLEPYPSLSAFCARVRALPAIKAYLASDRCIVAPCNNQHSTTTRLGVC